MPDHTPAEWKRGQRLLRELLPWARAEARKGDVKFEGASALGNSAATYLSEDKFDALMIYPAPKGGWHADLVLRSIPPGVPNGFGTPVERPCRTQAEAEDAGKRLLVVMLALAARNQGAAPAPPVFMLDGWKFTLHPDAFAIGMAFVPDFHGYGSQLQASARIERVLDELCPEGFDGKAFNAWPPEKKATLMAVLHGAALSGLFVYPMRQDQSPKDTGAA